MYHLCSSQISDSNTDTDQDHLNVTSQKKSHGSRCFVLAKGNLAAARLLLAVLLAGVDNGTAVEDLLATLSGVESLARNDAVDFCRISML